MKTSSAFVIVLTTLLQSSLGSVARSQILKRSNNLQSFALTIPPTPQDELTFLTRPGTPGADLTPLNSKKEWMTDCIDTHNYYRNLYRDNKAGKRLSVLAWNASLAQSAQNWAQYLISNSKPAIINPSYPYGESAGLNSYAWRDEFTCSPLIDNFYSKAATYKQRLKEWKSNPSAGAFNMNGIKPFTQMMWPNTTHVGCGFAQDSARKIEVCHYYPR